MRSQPSWDMINLEEVDIIEERDPDVRGGGWVIYLYDTRQIFEEERFFERS